MRTGIRLNENNELLMTSNRITLGDTTQQAQALLMQIQKGELKVHPLRGVGAVNYIESDDGDAFADEIRREFIADGMKVKSINMKIPQVIVVADYE